MQTLAVNARTAAEMVGLSLSSLRRQVRTGHIRAVKAGRRVLIPLNSLERFLQVNDEHPGPTEKLQQGKDAGGS